MAIRLDVSGMLRHAVPTGPDAAALDALAPRLTAAVAAHSSTRVFVDTTSSCPAVTMAH